VTFDVGGTLIHPWPSVGEVYCEVAAEFGYPNLAVAGLNQQFAKAWKSRASFDHSRSAWADLVRQTFDSLIPTPADEALFEALYRRFESAEVWRVYDDVLPVLERLKCAGMRLGIISNWDERLRPLLRELQLDHYFDPIIISCETGAIKPSTRIFERAVQALDLPAEFVLHVGDSLEEDVRGAEESGLRAVLLNRNETGQVGGPIQSLLGLPVFSFD